MTETISPTPTVEDSASSMSYPYRTQTAAVEGEFRQLSLEDRTDDSESVFSLWSVPVDRRVPIKAIPEILVSMYGLIKRDSVITDGGYVGEARLHYSSKVDAPFELFAVQWNGENFQPEELTPGNAHPHHLSPKIPATEPAEAQELALSDTLHSSSSDSPPDSPAASANPGKVQDDDSKTKHRSRAKSITHAVTKHLHARHFEVSPPPSGKLAVTQHNPSAYTFTKLIKLPPDTSLRSISPGEWDPNQEYSHIIINISAATGSPAKIYQASTLDGTMLYWIVGRVAGTDVLVGVSTYARFSNASLPEDAQPQSPAKDKPEVKTAIFKADGKDIKSAVFKT
ncbi:hypothetical protein V1512DRAFT_256621 [Lipomyces arxii]|uniref:uncharacterized protein n=1 Tax=Lipomyces arxii TaxID=56418 RepID=UPI0034CD1738